MVFHNRKTKTVIEMKCPNCGKLLSHLAKKETVFCSRKCWSETTRKANKRVCQNCGKEFVTNSGNKGRFCCMNCVNEWQRTNAHTTQLSHYGAKKMLRILQKEYPQIWAEAETKITKQERHSLLNFLNRRR